MFLIWTIATTWILFIFDYAWFERPIKDHSIRSLHVLLPMSPLEWIVVVSWVMPLLFVLLQALFTHRLQKLQGRSLVLFQFPNMLGGMGNFGWLQIFLAFVLAIIGWTLQITELLLPATIVTIGLSLSKLEHGLSLAY